MTPLCATMESEMVTHESLIEALYDILPEDGATLLFLNRDGQGLDAKEENPPPHAFLLEHWEAMIGRIDDGDDPVVLGSNDCTYVVTELECPIEELPYAVIALPQRSMDSVLQNFDLIQMVLGQFRLLCRHSL